MKKTVKEWLMELPKEHREKAIENTKKERGSGFLNIINHFSSIEDALFGSFIWGSSNEGHDYWCNVTKILNAPKKEN